MKKSLKRIFMILFVTLVVAFLVTITLFFADKETGSVSSAPVINEVLCSNSSSIKAYDGRYYDWIELYNPSGKEKSLDDYYLSDNYELQTKTSLKGQKIAPNGYLVIYCSGLDITDEKGFLHTGFKLSSSKGETIYLSDGSSVQSLIVPPSKENVSYGLTENGEYGWLDSPTPGAENSLTQSVPHSDVRINEFMVSNTFTIYDCEGDFGDWVELYNTSDKDVDISGFGLTDEEGDPVKFVFPDGTKIKAKGFLLVFCDGKDKTDKKGVIHTNFSLSAKDSSIALYSGNQTLISRVQINDMKANVSCGWDDSCNDYRFYARSTPGKENKGTSFEKLSEDMTPSPLGDVIISEVLSASYKNSKNSKTDFVELLNTTKETISLKGYTLSKKPGEKTYTFPDVKIGAGAYLVVYCDGKSRVSDGQIYSALKFNTGGEKLYLADASGAVCDIFSTGKGRIGVSSGRASGNTSARYFFTSPTPGKANSGRRYSGYSPVPEFSIDGGVVKAGTTVSISVSGDYTIVYTTDGTKPTEKSAVYKSPLVVSENTVIRAAAYGNNTLLSDCVTNTFLTDTNHTIPIFCVSGNPSQLTADHGIFIDKTNKSEFEIHTEYFNQSGSKETEFPCGVKLFGHSSSEMPQKGVKLCLREKYGLNEVTYPFFSANSKASTTFSTLLLRPSGEEQIYSKLRDELIPALVRGRMDLDFEEEQPCALYINGSYWGLYYIREALNADYLKTYYGYKKGEYDLIKGQSVAQEGSTSAYKKLTEFCKTHDLSDKKNYEYVKNQVDFDSLINFWIVETYFGNTDTVNIRCYKHKNGKWRWMVYDMDWSMQTTRYIRERNFIDWHLLNPKGHGIGHFDNSIIRKLLQNKEFRDHFLMVYCYHLNNTFAPERAVEILDDMANTIDGEIKLNQKKWNRPKYKDWSESTVPYLRKYLQQRPSEIKKNLMDSFNLSEKDWEKYISMSKEYHPEESAIK